MSSPPIGGIAKSSKPIHRQPKLITSPDLTSPRMKSSPKSDISIFSRHENCARREPTERAVLAIVRLGSRSNTATLIPGLRFDNASATARPTTPPPTTATCSDRRARAAPSTLAPRRPRNPSAARRIVAALRRRRPVGARRRYASILLRLRRQPGAPHDRAPHEGRHERRKH